MICSRGGRVQYQLQIRTLKSSQRTVVLCGVIKYISLFDNLKTCLLLILRAIRRHLEENHYNLAPEQSCSANYGSTNQDEDPVLTGKTLLSSFSGKGAGKALSPPAQWEIPATSLNKARTEKGSYILCMQETKSDFRIIALSRLLAFRHSVTDCARAGYNSANRHKETDIQD